MISTTKKFTHYLQQLRTKASTRSQNKIHSLQGQISQLRNKVQELSLENKVKDRRINTLFDKARSKGELSSNPTAGVSVPNQKLSLPWNKEKREFEKLVKELTSKQDALIKNVEAIKEEDRCIQVGDTIVRTHYLADLPNVLTLSPIHKLLHLPLPLNITYHIQGTSRGSMLEASKRRLSVLEAEQNERIKKGKNRDLDLDKEISEVNTLINDLVYDQERNFIVSLYTQLRAESKLDIIDYSKTLTQEMKDVECTFNTHTFGQLDAFTSTLPIAKDLIKRNMLLHTQAVVNLLPFLSKSFNDEEGILLGNSRINGTLVLVDLFKARNANINIFGTSGSGKSVTAKLIISRLLLRGIQSIVIDPEGEYTALVDAFGGQVVRFSPSSGFNIFQIPPSTSVNSHISTLKTFFSFYIQPSRYDSALLDKILVELYKQHHKPSLKLFYQACSSARAPFVQDIETLLNGSLSGIFSNEDDILIESDIVCFDLSQLITDELKIPAMFMVSSFINGLINTRDKRRMIFIDEAHKLLANKETIAFYIDLVKTARKRKAGVVSITQNPEDYREENGAKTILTQAETSFILKQAYSSIQYITDKKVFPLTQQELQELPTLGIGEALFIREKEHVLLDIYPFESEEEFVFT